MHPIVRRFIAALPGVIAVATLGIGATLFLVGSGGLAVVLFVIGWLLLTPLSAILIEDVLEIDESEASTTSSPTDADGADEDPVTILREQYARGRLDEDEFERRLEALLATEDLYVAGNGDPERVLERIRPTEGDGVTFESEDDPPMIEAGDDTIVDEDDRHRADHDDDGPALETETERESQ